MHTFLLCLFDKFFLALGAGDGDLTLAPGDPHLLTAAGAIEVAVIPVLDLIQQHEETAVFPVALVGVPGKRPEDRPEHQRVGCGGERQVHPGIADEQAQDAQHHAGAQDRSIQFVRAVASGHKPAQSGVDTAAEIPEPGAKALHNSPPAFDHAIIILQNFGIATIRIQCLRIVYFYAKIVDNTAEKWYLLFSTRLPISRPPGKGNPKRKGEFSLWI